MSAVLLGVFDDYLVAERARIALVRDGFATDRVDVSATSEPGRSRHVPAAPPTNASSDTSGRCWASATCWLRRT